MIKVKALEWRDYEHTSINNFYYVERNKNRQYVPYWFSQNQRITDEPLPTLTDAKAACQAHHEQHVLSMIEVEG